MNIVRRRQYIEVNQYQNTAEYKHITCVYFNLVNNARVEKQRITDANQQLYYLFTFFDFL